MYYIFENDGVAPIEALTSFGVSVKEGDNPIGEFGTGNKYFLSVVLRNNCDVKILSGIDEYDFGTEVVDIRGKDHTFVTMNGDKLGFTTHTGYKWEMWQALREVACNTLDEGGRWYTSKTIPICDNNKTYVVVSGQEFERVWKELDNIVLDKKVAPILYTSDKIEVFDKSSQFVYFNGVRVYTLPSTSRFTYNMLDKDQVDLTEDRTLAYEGFTINHMYKNCLNSNNIKVFKEWVSQSQSNSFESKYENGFYGVSLSHLSNECKEYVRARMGQVDRGLKQEIITLFEESTEDILLQSKEVDLNNIQKQQLEKAINFNKKLGFLVDKFPIKVYSSIGKNYLGQAYEGNILIALQCFELGTKQLAATIIEEFIHLEYEVFDETRSMQDLIFNKMMTLGEMITGEPL